MAYIALYRKYRSQSFGELMGQEQVTVTLQNAIRSGRIAHAYLFYGARGCGKTSTARLLARALNCAAQDGPTPEPCGTCRLCVSIREGTCMDVIEMDAASETGIDDVREKIIENVQYAPSEARYKVYIIDEVHDLSAKAFDALLKTLEEPPAHVIFILATTEQHKVPITIRSRCMPYHFKRGTLQDLAASVQRVVDAEGYNAEPEAVQAIARGAEGSWRDALSLLEQVLAYSDGVVTADTVHRAIGSVGSETLARVTETLAQGDWSAVLDIAGELIDSGKDVRQLLTALSGHLRDLMLISAGAKNAAQQELGPDRYNRLKAQAPLFAPGTLLAMMTVLAGAEREMRFSNQHRWILERTLLGIMPCHLQSTAPDMQHAPSRPTHAAIPGPVRPSSESIVATPTVIPRPQATPPIVGPSQPEAQEYEIAIAAEAVAASMPESAPLVADQAAAPAPGPASQSLTPAPPALSSPAPPVVSGDSRFADEVSLDVLHRAWPRILNLFRKASPSGAPWLEKGRLVALEGNVLVISFTDKFARDRIQGNEKGRAKVEQVINQALNSAGYKIRCMVDDDLPAPSAHSTALSESGAVYENMALLEAPENSTAAPVSSGTGFGDISREAPPTAQERGTSYTTTPAPVPPAPAASPTPVSPSSNGNSKQPVEGSMLAEALEVFGGTVVRTEPLP